MVGMKAEEAECFYEEDEDPQEVFAAFDASHKERTAPPAGSSAGGPMRRVRHELATALRRLANAIESPQARA